MIENDIKYFITGDSYHQCRNCGQFHNTTARDCGFEYSLTNIPNNPEIWRVLNGKLWQVLDDYPPSYSYKK